MHAISFNYMVESNKLDAIFLALADSTRRSILQQVAQAELSIGQIAQQYTLTLAAVSKHIAVLERAQLVSKQRRGKEVVVFMVPATFALAQEQLKVYAMVWEDRFIKLDTILKEL